LLKGGVVSALLRRANKDEKVILSGLAGILARQPKLAQANAQPGLSTESQTVLLKAKEEAATMKDDYVSAEHVLLALAESPSLSSLLKKLILEKQLS
jgi:ATP-dependent Clp protease ATP-binding subunit ClpB